MTQTHDLLLIGQYDSPYTRRAAVTAALLGLSFDHRPWSVFRDFDAIAAVNPGVKVPTLLVDGTTMLADSREIVAFLEELAERTLHPPGPAERLADRSLVGLGIMICEKTVQLVYEQQLRPIERQHAPWLERAARQLHGALDQAERQMPQRPGWVAGAAGPAHADVTLAVAWRQAAEMLPWVKAAGCWPCLAAASLHAEAHPAFLSVPFPT